MTTFLWLLVIVGGPALIAAVLAYGMLSRRRLTPIENTKRDEAIEELYDKR